MLKQEHADSKQTLTLYIIYTGIEADETTCNISERSPASRTVYRETRWRPRQRRESSWYLVEQRRHSSAPQTPWQHTQQLAHNDALQTLLHYQSVVWRSGNALCRINEVALRRARSVLGWVWMDWTVYGQVNHLGPKPAS